MNAPPTLEENGLLEQVEQLFSSGQQAEAHEVIDKIVDKQKESLNLADLSRLTRVMADVGDLAGALRVLENCVTQHPDAVAVRKLAARMAVRGALERSDARMELLRRAEAHLRHFLENHPSDARGHALAGVIYEQQGRLHEAVEGWRCAQVLNPSELDYRIGLAVALCALGRYREAVTHFELVAMRRPTRADVHVNLGLALRESGDLERALEVFAQAGQLRPKSARIKVDLGLTLRGLGRLDEALLAFREAVLLDPGRADSYHQFGRALLRAGRFDEASPILEHARRLEPNNLNIQRTLLELARVPAKSKKDDDEEEEDTLAVPAILGPDLQADLGRFAVADIVEFLGLGRRSGILQVHTPKAEGELEFIEGRLLSGWLMGEPSFSEQLIAHGLSMPGRLEQLEIERGIGPVLEAMLADGFDDPAGAIRELTYESSVKTLLSLLIQSSEGSVGFRSRVPGRPGQDSRLLEFGTVAQVILLEAFRRYDEVVSEPT